MAQLDLKNVGVHFLVRNVKASSLAGSVRAFATGGRITSERGQTSVAALEDVTFRLSDGDRLALIGHNGAGKSTLLRVMSGILPPTQGRVRIEGKVSSLMSINLGLNNDMSGYENIRIRARYMGESRKRVEEELENIAAFSELGDYLHLPLHTYSSGMRLRLAFAVSTAFTPDILILDEWLSAGDASFREKASARLEGLVERSPIFAFASHSEPLQRRICNKGVVLERGGVRFFGEIDDAIGIAKESRETQSTPARSSVG